MSTDLNPSKSAAVQPAAASPRAPGVLSALAQFARARLSRAADTPARLGIDALPDDLATLEHGALYAVQLAPRSPECDALIWETVRAAGERPVTVVLARERAQAAARLRELGFSGSAAPGWPRRLNVLAMPDEPVSRDEAAPNREAPPALARLFGGLRALRRFGLRRDALFIVEGAQRWFTWTDPAALAREARLLADWCATRGITMLLLLRDDAAAPESDVSPDFDEASDKSSGRELNGACAGVARVRRTDGELSWQVDFWRAGKALVTGDTRALRFTAEGRLSVASPEAKSAAMRIAHDEDRVVVCRAVTGDEPWVPRNWELHDDREAVVAACRDARAATVVLAHHNGAQLEQLCEAVHALRRRSGRALKIVVVERGEFLRHQYELLMLSLGANAVVGRDTPFSRLESMLQSVQGQLYTRPLMPDYRTALAASLADAALGYLNVAAFCAQAQAALARGAMLRLPHVLAKLALPPALAHVDALGQCRPRRAGDVFTADAAHLYVFLFGCRRSDADAALARIFTAPVEGIAEKVTYLSNEGIAAELDALDAANRRTPAADYSDLFAGPTLADQPASPAPAAAEPESVRRVRAELDALHEVLEHEARGHRADLTVAAEAMPRVRRAVPARMPLAGSRN